MWLNLIGAALGAAGSYFGSKSQADATEDANDRQINMLRNAATELSESYDQIIGQVNRNPSLYAGSKVQGVAYDPINLKGSQAQALASNFGNLSSMQQLAGQANQGTLDNDLNRIRQMFPDFDSVLGNLSSSANSLSSGQLPFDSIQDIISNRSSSSAAFGIPGGSGPATLRDLGLSSLDATQAGASMFQNILQAADQHVSPVSRQVAAPQFFASGQESVALDLNQAQLQQNSGQNIANLAAQPDPGKNLVMQLMLQQANTRAGTQAQVAGLGQPAVPTSLGIASQTLFPAAQQMMATAFPQTTGYNPQTAGFDSNAYNKYAKNYNATVPGANKAIVV